MVFSELVILVVEEIGALSVADGYYCTYSFGGRLDLLGWRTLDAWDIMLSHCG